MATCRRRVLVDFQESRWQWLSVKRPAEERYHLRGEPAQFNNIAVDKAQAADRQKLSQRLRQ